MDEVYTRRDILLKLQIIIAKLFTANTDEYLNWIEDARVQLLNEEQHTEMISKLSSCPNAAKIKGTTMIGIEFRMN
jgi:hypothetical protein